MSYCVHVDLPSRVCGRHDALQINNKCGTTHKLLGGLFLSNSCWRDIESKPCVTSIIRMMDVSSDDVSSVCATVPIKCRLCAWGIYTWVAVKCPRCQMTTCIHQMDDHINANHRCPFVHTTISGHVLGGCDSCDKPLTRDIVHGWRYNIGRRDCIQLTAVAMNMHPNDNTCDIHVCGACDILLFRRQTILMPLCISKDVTNDSMWSFDVITTATSLPQSQNNITFNIDKRVFIDLFVLITRNIIMHTRNISNYRIMRLNPKFMSTATRIGILVALLSSSILEAIPFETFTISGSNKSSKYDRLRTQLKTQHLYQMNELTFAIPCLIPDVITIVSGYYNQLAFAISSIQ